MFWKKKNHSEALVFLESNDARKSFRVCPLLSEPIRIEFHGKSIALENIGAEGISFQNEGFVPGDSQHIALDLPGENTTISVTAKIIHIDADGMCHCQFLGLSEDGHNAIHRYMLAVQIEEVRGKKNAVGRIRPSGKPAGSHKFSQTVPQELPGGRGAYHRPGRSPSACK